MNTTIIILIYRDDSYEGGGRGRVMRRRETHIIMTLWLNTKISMVNFGKNTVKLWVLHKIAFYVIPRDIVHTYIYEETWQVVGSAMYLSHVLLLFKLIAASVVMEPVGVGPSKKQRKYIFDHFCSSLSYNHNIRFSVKLLNSGIL